MTLNIAILKTKRIELASFKEIVAVYKSIIKLVLIMPKRKEITITVPFLQEEL